jgi:hypothetical protein
MFKTIAVLIVVLMLVVVPTPGMAQTAYDPTGHWVGSIAAPFGEVPVIIDIGRKADGAVIGTFSQPDQGINGLPLAHLKIEGKSIEFQIAASSSGEFNGTFQGASMAGTYSMPLGTAQFELKRIGDAQFERAPVSRAISTSLEGEWRGTLAVDGAGLRLGMTLTNHAGGTSTGLVTSFDRGNAQVPVGITQDGAAVTISIAATGATYVAALNAAGTELTGTYSERGGSFPLTFSRVP